MYLQQVVGPFTTEYISTLDYFYVLWAFTTRCSTAASRAQDQIDTSESKVLDTALEKEKALLTVEKRFLCSTHIIHIPHA